MKTWTPGLLFASLLFSTGGEIGAQEQIDGRVVKLVEEPRHRPVWSNEFATLHDVRVLPGDTSLYHVHDVPVLLGTLSTGNTGPTGGRLSANLEYGVTPFTHRVINNGPHPLRILALTNSSQGESDVTESRPQGLVGEPAVENALFRAYRIELAPGAETAVHQHRHAAIVALATDGRVNVTRADGWWSELQGMSDFTVREADSPYRIRNVGTTPVAVLISEARRPR